MQKLVSVTEMRAIEQAADAAGWSYSKMMQQAGKSLANTILAYSHRRAQRILGLVGTGNNGGDALVALRHLAEAGWNTEAIIIGKRLTSDPLMKRAKKAGMEVLKSAKAINKTSHKADVILDGLLGTGIKLPLRREISSTLDQVNEAIRVREKLPWVVAVDCPSGMDCETGEVAPETLKADLTVSMAAVKRGMLSLSAFEYLGELVIGEIGLPADLPLWAAIRRQVIDADLALGALPARPLNSHKGTFGTALIVAGSQRFPGAALLAGEAAYRSGAGLVTLAVPQNIQPSLAGQLREATWLPLPEEAGWISAEAGELVVSNLERVTAILLGPGFGQAVSTRDFIQQLLAATLPPLILDADALKLLTEIKNWQQRLPAESILTPHPGEMAILTGKDIDSIQANRIEIAEEAAQSWKHVVVLKGAFTVVAAPDGRSAVLPLASASLARAGTGDVLAGIITGLRAQGMPAYDAACSAVWLHGQAGLRAAQNLGSSAGLLAGDLIAEIPYLMPY